MKTQHQKRRLVVGAVATVAALTLAGCAADSGEGTDPGVIELPIGATVEATGGASAIGVQWQRGIELAVDKANGDNGFTVGEQTYKWKLQLEDNQSLPDQAIATYRSFLGSGTDFILGPGLSTAFTPAYNSLGGETPFVLTPANGAAFIGTPEGENLFLTHLIDTGEDGRVADMVDILMAEYSPERIAILLPQDAPGELYTSTFGEFFTKAGAEIVYSEAFPGDTRDFASYVTAIRAADPDLVLSGYLDTWMVPFLSQSIGAGLTDPVFVGAPGTNVTSVSGDNASIANFAWSVSTRAVNNEDDPRVQEYRQAYTAKYGQEPDATAFWGLSYYDPILLLTKAIQEAGTVDDLDAIREAFLSVELGDEGVLDESFDSTTHRAVYSPQIGFYRDGEITYVEAN